VPVEVVDGSFAIHNAQLFLPLSPQAHIVQSLLARRTAWQSKRDQGLQSTLHCWFHGTRQAFPETWYLERRNRLPVCPNSASYTDCLSAQRRYHGWVVVIVIALVPGLASRFNMQATIRRVNLHRATPKPCLGCVTRASVEASKCVVHVIL
jgi:hypothetical protein